MRITLDEILEMNKHELFEYITQECLERGIAFDPDALGDSNMGELYDFIADNINPEFQAELHSECQMRPGCNMFPNTETEEELEEEMEHEVSRN